MEEDRDNYEIEKSYFKRTGLIFGLVSIFLFGSLFYFSIESRHSPFLLNFGPAIGGVISFVGGIIFAGISINYLSKATLDKSSQLNVKINPTVYFSIIIIILITAYLLIHYY
jgi:hypothetical protein